MYTGMGEYTNDLVDGGAGPSVAAFASAGDETGAITITHKEYIGEIYANPASQPFVNQSYPLNPGLEQTFPWLSQLAANYEEYEFTQLMFTYRTVVADISSANGQVGTVIMATNYNPSSPPFTDKSEMMTYAHSSSAKTSESLVHGIECDPAKLSGDPGKYTRTKPILSGQDLKTYDWGLFQIACANPPSTMANNSIGELWVAYTVVLRKPKVSTGKGDAISRYLVVSPNAALTVQYPLGQNTITAPSLGGVPRMLFAQQNSLALSLYAGPGAANPYATGPFHQGNYPTLSPSANPARSEHTLAFPGSYAGVVRIVITFEGRATAGAISQRMMLGLPAFQGNVYQYNDMFGVGSTSAGVVTNVDTPSWFQQTPFIFGAALTADMTNCLIIHVRVEPASNGITNALIWGQAGSDNLYQDSLTGSQLVAHNYSSLTPQQMYFDVSEYNSSWGTYVNPVPVFVDAAGTVTNPY